MIRSILERNKSTRKALTLRQLACCDGDVSEEPAERRKAQRGEGFVSKVLSAATSRLLIMSFLIGLLQKLLKELPKHYVKCNIIHIPMEIRHTCFAISNKATTTESVHSSSFALFSDY